MKKSILLIILLLSNYSNLFAQNEESIYSLTNGIIKGNYKWIDPFYKGYDISKNTYSYQSNTQLTAGTSQYTIETGVLNDFEDIGENGFNVISVYKKGEKILELRQPDFWTFTYGGGSEINYSMYTSYKYFVPLISTNKTKVLAFIGWPYGGDLSLLTIIAITENDAKLVFNKNVDINKIEKKDGVSEIKIQTLLEEYDSCGKLCVAPTYATMIAKDGILYWKE